jgi:hypothetical protein
LDRRYPIACGTYLKKEYTREEWRPFESGVVKIQGGQENLLTDAEKEALAPLLLRQVDVEEGNDNALDEGEGSPGGAAGFFKRAVRQRLNEIPASASTSKYINVNFVSPVDNVCERLFSNTRKVWREDRKKMTPAHMEVMMVLKINRDLWDDRTVFKIRNNPRRRPAVGVPPVAGAVAGAVAAVEEIEDPLLLPALPPEDENYAMAFMGDGHDDVWNERDGEDENINEENEMYEEAEMDGIEIVF